MSSFWRDAYDEDKDKRYGALFFSALMGCFLSVGVAGAIAAITRTDFFGDYGPVALVCVAIFAAVLFWLFFQWFRGRKARKDQLKYSTLSRDELAKARSKLKRQMMSTKPVIFKREIRPARRPPPRSPDTDLKY